MGFLFRVRLASFFAGAAAASLAGFCLLYKDYMLAHGAIAQQVPPLSYLSLHPPSRLRTVYHFLRSHGLSIDRSIHIGKLDRKQDIIRNLEEAKGVYEDFDERFESLNKRVTSLENQKKSETSKPAEIFD
ncbi:hypothetical protein MUK42_08138 [Musa troglodytarum]|uniref:Uncharacterized protein n=1 Tax=Musa troglodytarum TaxID=320322 RepID=A0A9E7EH39_9LILI|nr:hypothetical protein MUK42_08138 [Musa troglodytarum]